jgi:hypothetical protein
MSNDPRLDVLDEELAHMTYTALDGVAIWSAPEVLAAIDAADPLRRSLTPGTDEHEAIVERMAGRLDLISLTWQRVTREVQDDDSTPPYLDTSMVQRDVPDIVRAVLAALRDLT